MRRRRGRKERRCLISRLLLRLLLISHCWIRSGGRSCRIQRSSRRRRRIVIVVVVVVLLQTRPVVLDRRVVDPMRQRRTRKARGIAVRRGGVLRIRLRWTVVNHGMMLLMRLP